MTDVKCICKSGKKKMVYREDMELIKKYALRYAEKKEKQHELEEPWSEERTRNTVYVKKATENYRKICEKKIRRKLCPGEHVHHINGVHNDNRPENLEPLSSNEHGKKHGFVWR